MEKYFDLGRAYYTYLKSSTQKDQCTVSVICDDIDIKDDESFIITDVEFIDDKKYLHIQKKWLKEPIKYMHYKKESVGIFGYPNFLGASNLGGNPGDKNEK